MIKLLLSDVDGTLVRSDKSLAPSTVEAVHALHDAGVHFSR
jgi:hydroxymethylpyrimidine pyrophosphatase-like HAD family hydrolase